MRLPSLLLLHVAAALVGCGSVDVVETDGGPMTACPEGRYGGTMVEVPALDGTSYCMDPTEVTNRVYQAFLDDAPSLDLRPPACTEWPQVDDAFLESFVEDLETYQPTSWPPAEGREEYPVVGITWCSAAAFCHADRKRLCGKIGGGALAFFVNDVEQELTDESYADPKLDEFANAMTRGGTRKYVYGDTYEDERCFVPGSHGSFELGPVKSRAGCEGGFPGLFDLGGNVYEFENALVYSPSIPTLPREAVSRGARDAINIDRTTFTGTSDITGIRCCADTLPKKP